MGFIDKLKTVINGDRTVNNQEYYNSDFDRIDYNYYEYGDYPSKEENIFFRQNINKNTPNSISVVNDREYIPMIEYGIESGYMKVNTGYIDNKADSILRMETEINPNLDNVISTLDGSYPGRINREDKLKELTIKEPAVNPNGKEEYVEIDNLLDLTLTPNINADLHEEINNNNLNLDSVLSNREFSSSKPLKELKIDRDIEDIDNERLDKVVRDIDSMNIEKMADELESEKRVERRLQAHKRREKAFGGEMSTVGGLNRSYEKTGKDFEKYKYQISVTDYNLYKEYLDIMSSRDKNKIKRIYPIIIPRQYNIVDFVGFIETETDIDIEPVIMDIQIVKDKSDIPLLYGLVFEQIFNNFGKFRIDSDLANDLKLITVLSRVLKCPFQNNQFYYGYLSNAIMNRLKAVKYPELNISYKNKNTKHMMLPNKGKYEEEVNLYNQMSTTYEYEKKSRKIEENRKIVEENNIIRNSTLDRVKDKYNINFDDKE